MNNLVEFSFNYKQIPMENLTREGLIHCYETYYQKAIETNKLINEMKIKLLNITDEDEKKLIIENQEKIFEILYSHKDFITKIFLPFDREYSRNYVNALIGEEEELKMIPQLGEMDQNFKYTAQISKLRTVPFNDYVGQVGFQLIVFTPPKNKFVKLELNAWGDATFQYTNSIEKRFRWLYNPKEHNGRVSLEMPFTGCFNKKEEYLKIKEKITQDLSAIRIEPLQKMRMISSQCLLPLIPSTLIFDYAQDYYLHPNVGTQKWPQYPESTRPESLDISVLPIVTYRFEKPLKVMEGICTLSGQFVSDVFKIIMGYDSDDSIKEPISINPENHIAQYGVI